MSDGWRPLQSSWGVVVMVLAGLGAVAVLTVVVILLLDGLAVGEPPAGGCR